MKIEDTLYLESYDGTDAVYKGYLSFKRDNTIFQPEVSLSLKNYTFDQHLPFEIEIEVSYED